MSVELESRTFKVRTFAGSSIFLSGFALAIGGKLFFHVEQLTPILLSDNVDNKVLRR